MRHFPIRFSSLFTGQNHYCIKCITYAWAKRRQTGFVPREIARTHATAFPSRLGSVALEILRRNSVTSTLLGEISEYAASRYDNSQVSPPLA